MKDRRSPDLPLRASEGLRQKVLFHSPEWDANFLIGEFDPGSD